MNNSALNKVISEASLSSKDILNTYLLKLQKCYGININLHDVAGVGTVNPELEEIFFRHQYHDNPFCNHVKKNNCAFRRCVENKEKLCNRCRELKAPFYGTCYMGITEFVYPIFCEDKLIAIICVGQFSDDLEKSEQCIAYHSPRYGFDYAQTLEHFRHTVKNTEFDVKGLVEDIALLAELISLTFKNGLKDSGIRRNKGLSEAFDIHKNNFILSNTIRFISENFDKDLSLKLLASNSFCNHTYLSYLFKEKMKICITDYINKIRIEKSKELLNITSWPITEVSSSVGFNDSGYFTRVFKNLEGITPKDYRERKS